ncbi:MAG: TfoX/Sxy family protein [Propionibacteriaceae bacterium]|nr:TfoX/Sxy family protein [Propionibacteriaceae bacterium]
MRAMTWRHRPAWPSALRRVGAQEAYLRIRDQVDPGACLALFTGLECAVRGVRTTELTSAERTQLRVRFKALPTGD